MKNDRIDSYSKKWKTKTTNRAKTPRDYLPFSEQEIPTILISPNYVQLQAIKGREILNKALILRAAKQILKSLKPVW